jgi:hypothetical protein
MPSHLLHRLYIKPTERASTQAGADKDGYRDIKNAIESNPEFVSVANKAIEFWFDSEVVSLERKEMLVEEFEELRGVLNFDNNTFMSPKSSTSMREFPTVLADIPDQPDQVGQASPAHRRSNQDQQEAVTNAQIRLLVNHARAGQGLPPLEGLEESRLKTDIQDSPYSTGELIGIVQYIQGSNSEDPPSLRVLNDPSSPVGKIN